MKQTKSYQIKNSVYLTGFKTITPIKEVTQEQRRKDNQRRYYWNESIATMFKNWA